MDKMNDTSIAVALFCVVYAVYYATAFPSVTGGDSGELLAESCQLGTAHPPGYPLFTMISHVAAMIPVHHLIFDFKSWSVSLDPTASVAWRVNHLCCIFGAATAVCIWLSSRLIVKSLRIAEPAAPYLSTLGALGYAFTPLVWEYSTTAEVFALNNCLCAALLLLTCRTIAHLTASAAGAAVAVQDTPEASQRSGSTNTILRLSSAGGLLCGLALSNQHASLLLVSFVAPTILAVTFLYAPALLSSVLLCAAAGFFAGFATYLYLPWAAAQPTPGSWGELASIAGLFRHVIRAEYGTFRLGMIIGSETWWERIWIYLKHTSEESQHFVFPILLLGFIALALLPSVGKEASTEPPATPSAPIQQTPTIFKSKVKSRGASQNPVLSQRLNSAPPRTSRADWTRALLALLVLAMWLFYVLLWHCVLSNLPLSAPMPFAVHSRFWMQPNILLYTLLCCAVDLVVRYAAAVVAEGRGRAGLRGAVRSATECAIVVAYISVTLYLRYDSMDKSTAGDVMYRYGSAVLSAVMPERAESADSQVPLQSLLLSHTDLDWNPVRYLQHCEGVGSEPRRYFKRSPLRAFALQPFLPPTTLVTHLSFQLMPYPWFAQTQAPLYPHVAFADTDFAGVTTDRQSEGNAQLVLRFLTANNVHNQTYFAVPRGHLEKQYTSQDQQDLAALPVLQSTHGVFTGGIYLDMQSIQEAEIEAYGAWRGAYTLIPWGPVYRVFGRLSLPQIQELHHHSLHQLRRLQTSFPAVDAHFMEKFIPGSWERAAANVYYDAHYQLGVNLLTYAIELQGKIEMKILPLLLDRYYVSALLLRQTLDAAQTFDTFSSSVADLSKNTALAWMRLHALMEIVTKFSKEIGKEVLKIKSLPADALSQGLLNTTAVEFLLAPQAVPQIRTAARSVLGGFIASYPQDRDWAVFVHAHRSMGV